MIPDPFETRLRRALDAPAADVARTVREAFQRKARTRGRRLAILAGAAAVAAGLSVILSWRIADWRSPVVPAPPVTMISNEGNIVRVRSGDWTLIFGGGDVAERTSTERRLWVSVGERR